MRASTLVIKRRAWVFNRMHGKGLFSWSDGRTYEGEYTRDQKEGLGVFRWPDGRQYEGQWKDGKQHGFGIHSTARGERREGEWEDGRRTRWVIRAEVSGGEVTYGVAPEVV